VDSGREAHGQESGYDTASWLIEELQPPAKPSPEERVREEEDEAAAWLPRGDESANAGSEADSLNRRRDQLHDGGAATADREAEGGAHTTVPDVPAPGAADLWAAIEELRRELSRARSEASAEIRETIQVHAVSAAQEHDAVARALGSFSARMDGLEARLTEMARQAESAWTLGLVDLNAASFEELRRLGLSATQAARVISHREAVGGFDTVEQLRNIPGLPDGTFEAVAPRLTI
jgi:competence ComEA-like helix-hairpin-helix protein